METKINMLEVREDLKRKIKDKKNVNYVENASEFCYLAGQVIGYLVTNDKRRLKQTQDISKYIRSNDIQKLKQNINQFYLQICACLPLNNYKFNNAYGMINNYLENFPLDENFFMAGFMSFNSLKK